MEVSVSPFLHANSCRPDTPLSGRSSFAKVSKEQQIRNELNIRVITQPSQPTIKAKLPSTATELLTQMYEALIMSKNCELPSLLFWSRYNLDSRNCIDYTPQSLQEILTTVGVECNTQAEGSSATISTGRWLLLRHGHFLLRAQHTLEWVNQQPIVSAVGNAEEDARNRAPVVWDWKSTAEKWRWQIWQSNHERWLNSV